MTAFDLPNAPPPSFRLKSGYPPPSSRPCAPLDRYRAFCSDASASLSCDIVVQTLGVRTPVFGFEFGPRLLESLHLGRLNAIQFQDVVAELGFHGTGDLIDLHGKGGIGEGAHEYLAVRPAEIAALRRGSRILRELLGELREILARLRALHHARLWPWPLHHLSDH